MDRCPALTLSGMMLGHRPSESCLCIPPKIHSSFPDGALNGQGCLEVPCRILLTSPVSSHDQEMQFLGPSYIPQFSVELGVS